MVYFGADWGRNLPNVQFPKIPSTFKVCVMIQGSTFLCMAALKSALQLLSILLEVLYLGLQLLTPLSPLLLFLLQLLLQMMGDRL